MKVAILSAIVTGAVALNPAEKFHWKRNNATMIANSASGGSTGTGVVLPSAAATSDLTTIVIATTRVETITKCKPTVTACPVGSGVSSLPPDAVYTEYTTSTVVLATTVCPVSEVQEVSASMISSISQVNVGVPTGPEITTTQPFSPIGIPTGGVGNGGGGTTDGNMGYGGDSTTDATTTTTKTTRATSTITITRVPSGGSGPDSGLGIGNGYPECTPVTVFVTKPPETVYVTVVPDTSLPSDTGLPPDAGLPPTTTSVFDSSPGTSNPPISEEDDEDDCPVEEEPSSTTDTIIEVTATVIPFPANGTMTKTPSPVGSNSAIPGYAFSRFARRSPHHF